MTRLSAPTLAMARRRPSLCLVMHTVTLTGNLLAEWTFEMDSATPGKTHRARETRFQVGGKGINVSRVLKRLGETSEAVAFAEGPLAGLCTGWLERQDIKHRFFPLENGVRPGLVVREKSGGPETTFLGADLDVPVSSWKSACQFTEQSRPAWLAICGSIPGWSASWGHPVRRIAESGIRVALDTYGPPLADLVKLPLELVKINRTELNRLFPDTENLPVETAVARAREDSPVKNWIITDGPRSLHACFADGQGHTVTPARIREVSPTGSGDTFLAAILHKWPDAGDYLGALAYATACATANAASAAIGDFPMPLPDRFFPEID